MRSARLWWTWFAAIMQFSTRQKDCYELELELDPEKGECQNGESLQARR